MDNNQGVISPADRPISANRPLIEYTQKVDSPWFYSLVLLSIVILLASFWAWALLPPLYSLDCGTDYNEDWWWECYNYSRFLAIR